MREGVNLGDKGWSIRPPRAFPLPGLTAYGILAPFYGKLILIASKIYAPHDDCCNLIPLEGETGWASKRPYVRSQR